MNDLEGLPCFYMTSVTDDVVFTTELAHWWKTNVNWSKINVWFKLFPPLLTARRVSFFRQSFLSSFWSQDYMFPLHSLITRIHRIWIELSMSPFVRNSGICEILPCENPETAKFLLVESGVPLTIGNRKQVLPVKNPESRTWIPPMRGEKYSIILRLCETALIPLP